MLRHLLLFCCIALSAIACCQDPDPKGKDEPVPDQQHPIFTWLTPSGAHSQVSHASAMSFQIRTTIIFINSPSSELPSDKENPDQHESDPAGPEESKQQPHSFGRSQSEIEQGYHELPYHTQRVKGATPLTPKIGTCGPLTPKGWSSDRNCGHLSWSGGGFVIEPGKALDLELGRTDIVGATLNGAPLFVMRTCSGHTEIKTSRRLFSGTFQLVIQSANAEKYTLSVGGTGPVPAPIAAESICQKAAPVRSLVYRPLFMTWGA